jgi:hypothetical protein
MKNSILIILLACISFSSYSRELTNDEKKVVEDSVKNDLKDPFSVVFYHDDFPYPDKTFVYCGYYNAKNSYGAYTGKRLFAVMLSKNSEGRLVAPRLDINSSTGEENDISVVSFTCASAGYNIPVRKMFFKDVNKERYKSGIPELNKEFLRN